ncbi:MULTISPECIES: flagellar export protein FliJ [unclassified Duganella]|jgi:flagellar export protein FliJ|uniref:flagellar export protein FliJ n=1 Tax=unclassified Duganella TaxID=2636909 RepID=UPI0008809924|nr:MULTISPECIES: flagellar export protein FliJ [unclassified Duganella]SDF68364.1 flagellar export protein FliJ [Duganella sp. OV458]SDI60824.1 flagellar export protein FliJ [Duganella sp. OV510]
MSQHKIRNLTTLVALRNTEVERLQTEMAEKTNLRDRYQKNLERLTSLYTNSGASGNLHPALAGNCGNYKQAVMAMADSHRLDLHMHEADMAVSQQALNAAWAKREVLGKVLDKTQKVVNREQNAKERKQHDELATQLWLRGQK